MFEKEDILKVEALWLIFNNNRRLSSLDSKNSYGELKKPFENKNKHIRSKGPTPNTNKTIFAVLGVVFFSSFSWIILELNFFFDFCLGILKKVKKL